MARWFDAPIVRLKGLLETLPTNAGPPRVLFIQRTTSEFIRETKVRVTNLPLVSKREIYDVLADIEDAIGNTLKICEGFAQDPSLQDKLQTQMTEAVAVLDDLSWCLTTESEKKDAMRASHFRSSRAAFAAGNPAPSPPRLAVASPRASGPPSTTRPLARPPASLVKSAVTSSNSPVKVASEKIDYSTSRRSSADAVALGNKRHQNVAPKPVDIASSIQDLKRDILSAVDSIDRNAKRSNFVETAAAALEDASDEFLDFFRQLSKSPKFLNYPDRQALLNDNLSKFDPAVLDFIDAASKLSSDPDDTELQDDLDDKLDAFEDVLYQICSLSLALYDDDKPNTDSNSTSPKPVIQTTALPRQSAVAMTTLPQQPQQPQQPSQTTGWVITSTGSPPQEPAPAVSQIPTIAGRYKRTTSRNLPSSYNGTPIPSLDPVQQTSIPTPTPTPTPTSAPKIATQTPGDNPRLHRKSRLYEDFGLSRQATSNTLRSRRLSTMSIVDDKRVKSRPVSSIGLSFNKLLAAEDLGSRPRSQEMAFVPVIRDQEESPLRQSQPNEKQLRRRTRVIAQNEDNHRRLEHRMSVQGLVVPKTDPSAAAGRPRPAANWTGSRKNYRTLEHVPTHKKHPTGNLPTQQKQNASGPMPTPMQPKQTQPIAIPKTATPTHSSATSSPTSPARPSALPPRPTSRPPTIEDAEDMTYAPRAISPTTTLSPVTASPTHSPTHGSVPRRAAAGGGPPKPVMPLKIEPEEEDEDWSDDDDEIMAQQRAEFAKLFGASVQSLVDSKADEEFFNSVDKIESLVEKCNVAVKKGSHAAQFIHHTLSNVIEQLTSLLREQAHEMDWNPTLQLQRYELVDDLEDLTENFVGTIKAIYRKPSDPSLLSNLEKITAEFDKMIADLSEHKEAEVEKRQQRDAAVEEQPAPVVITPPELAPLRDVTPPQRPFRPAEGPKIPSGSAPQRDESPSKSQATEEDKKKKGKKVSLFHWNSSPSKGTAPPAVPTLARRSERRLSIAPTTDFLKVEVSEPKKDGNKWIFEMKIDSDLPSYNRKKGVPIRRSFNQLRALFERISDHNDLGMWFAFPEKSEPTSKIKALERRETVVKLMNIISRDAELRLKPIVLMFLDPNHSFHYVPIT